MEETGTEMRYNMQKKGVLTVISGFSGVGKGTVVKQLVKRFEYALSISATTRQPREGEVDGREYFFKTREQFLEMIRNHELIEYAEYVDNFYGTPKAFVVQMLEQGRDVILEIEMQGALHVREVMPQANLIFLAPPGANVLKERLEGRGTESENVIEKRLKRAVEECAYLKDYDYVVVNDDLETCVLQIHQLIQSLHCKKEEQQEFIGQMMKDFENFLK